MVKDINQFDIFFVSLDPMLGSEIKKTRPCIILSPKELLKLNTVLIAPLTSKGFEYPFRVKTKVKDKEGLILLDQIRSVDKARLINKLAVLDNKTIKELKETLSKLFS